MVLSYESIATSDDLFKHGNVLIKGRVSVHTTGAGQWVPSAATTPATMFAFQARPRQSFGHSLM